MLTSIHIENFKCFKAATIPMFPLTVVSGGNGVGKSSIIQSLLLLRQSADQLRVLEDLGGLSAAGTTEFPVRLNGVYNLALGNSLTVTNTGIESGEFHIGVTSSKTSLRSTFIADAATARVTASCLHSASNSAEMLKRVGGLPLFAREFHYLVAERLGPRDLSVVSDGSYASTGYAGEFTADAIDRSERSPVQSALQLSADSDLFKVQLETWMSKLVPGIRISTIRYPEINRVRMSIERAGSSSQAMSPTNTGFGISYSLPIVVSGLLAKPGSLLIVENPEAHLHPSAQSAIGQFLACVASAGIQVLVETHSENVINGVRVAAVNGLISHDDVGFLFLSLNDGDTQPEISRITVDASSELSAWPAGFFDQQGRDLAELMIARRAQRSS